MTTHPEDRPPPPGRGERILLLEDDPRVMQFTVKQLTGLGYKVTPVSTPADAMNLLSQQEFDLFFSDVILGPGISGVVVARRARQIRPQIRVLLTSGYPTESFERDGKPDADMPLLSKPYHRRTLAEAIRAALGLG